MPLPHYSYSKTDPMKPIKKKLYTLQKASNSTGSSNSGSIMTALSSITFPASATKASSTSRKKKIISTIPVSNYKNVAKNTQLNVKKKIYRLQKASSSTNSDDIFADAARTYEVSNGINSNTKTMSSLMIQLDSTKTIMVIIAIGLAAYVFLNKDKK